MRSILENRILKLKEKRGQLQTLYPAVLTFVLVGILLGVGLLILAEVQDQIRETVTQNATAANAVNDTEVAITKIVDFLPIIAIAIAAAIILAIVIGAFAVRRTKGGY